MPPLRWGLFYCVINVRVGTKLRRMRQVGVEKMGFCDATLLVGVKNGVTRAVFILITSLRHFFKSVSVSHREKIVRKEIPDATRLLRLF